MQDLFGLFPEIYRAFYDGTGACDPPQWDLEKKSRIAAHWKEKLAHVPHLPLQWKTYLREPDRLLTERETDPETARSYDRLYRCRAPMRLLDQDEFPIEGPAEEHFFQWLQKPESPCALLLGDFGDGKSFFTYVLARRLAEEFWKSPERGWIPLRLSLRELGDHPLRSRQVFHNRLLEFCGGVSSWNEIRGRYHFLIILDGLDEMSLGMNDTAVLDNLTILEELIEQFSGYKILVTSRKMVIYSDKVRSRILSVLKKPEILHLAPLARRDCVTFLEQLADTPARKRRLLKIRHTHDLLGLAEKPLFLSMILEQLDSDDIQTSDLFGIYHDYAQKTLERKFSYQLTLAGNYTPKETICSNLLELLEELAVYMQLTGRDSVSLDEFRAHSSIGGLVQLLWSCVDGSNAEQEEDAEHRVSSRSLLKYDGGCPENRRFCHRSMKEYFVACGLIRKLCADRDSVRELLMNSNLSYEICLFAGKAFQALSAAQRRLVQQNLVELAHETRGMPRKAALGANCVNLLHCGGLDLPGEDWSGLVLDNAMLSGANLSGKNLSRSSMRFAHLDNADMTACDLRGCDFTGVQFERSGQLRAFSLDAHENTLLAYYQDGKLRRWEADSGAVQTLAQLEPGKRVRLVSGPEGREGAVFPERFQFWNRGVRDLRPAGYIPLRPGVQLLDMGHANVLIGQGRQALLLDIDQGNILQQHKFSSSVVYGALLSEQSFVLWLEEQSLALVNGVGAPNNPLLTLRDGRVTSLRVNTVTQTEKRIVLGCEDGSVKCLAAVLREDGERWAVGEAADLLKCGSQIVDTAFCGSQELFAGTASGSITRYDANDLGELEANKIYQLDLKCTGAQIEGVRPPEQYEILRRAASSQALQY